MKVQVITPNKTPVEASLTGGLNHPPNLYPLVSPQRPPKWGLFEYAAYGFEVTADFLLLAFFTVLVFALVLLGLPFAAVGYLLRGIK